MFASGRRTLASEPRGLVTEGGLLASGCGMFVIGHRILAAGR
jgi:hypothetical protein